MSGALTRLLTEAEDQGAKFPLPPARLSVVLYAAAQGLHERSALCGDPLAPLLDDLLGLALER